ncbi:MAG: hypothetical protein F6K41_43755 [Symploca sp. SIO3E6]|nr:hypothetical protein [Caldora sp. SIO3E6]
MEKSSSLSISLHWQDASSTGVEIIAVGLPLATPNLLYAIARTIAQLGYTPEILLKTIVSTGAQLLHYYL